MLRSRLAVSMLAVVAAVLVVAPNATAQGGGGGSCAPLTTQVQLVHSDSGRQRY